MSMIWRQAPMLRLCLPFACGIFLHDAFPSLAQWYWALGIFGLLFLWIGFQVYRLWFTQRHWFGVGVVFVFFSAGAFRHSVDHSLRRDFNEVLLAKQGYALIKLNSRPVERENSFRLEAKYLGLYRDSNVVHAQGNVLLYLQKTNAIQSLKREDILLVKSDFQRVNGPQGPGEFNAQWYYARKGIYHQMYADSSDWQFVQESNEHSVAYYFELWRNRALQLLQLHGVEGVEYGVLAALILGDTSEMDQDIMKSYAAAGVVHVLAVSGLHVGLVYVLLAPIFARLFGKSKARWLRTFLPMAILWGYSALSGGSPSVLRVAVMFSAFLFADNFGKRNNIYNTMAASAFVLVLWRPSILFELGFQLSYLAVLGIVILQKPIYQLIDIQNKWLDKLWSLSVVSIAAQLVTIPITIFYFHQFPNYFLFSNLFIIPWSTLIIYISILFFCLCPWPRLAHLCAELMVWMTKGMNQVIIWFDRLPGSVTTGIPCNLMQAIALSAFLFFTLRWLLWKKSRALFGTLMALIFWVGSIGLTKYVTQSSAATMLHAQKSGWCISQRVGQEVVVYSKGTDTTWSRLYGMHQVMMNQLCRDPEKKSIESLTHPVLRLHGAEIYFADSASIAQYGLLQVDILVLHDLGRLKLKKEALAALHDCTLITDRSISKSRLNWMKKQTAGSVNFVEAKKGCWTIQGKVVIPYEPG
jgi:competence protein ComEC